jgi:hypothetical protein
MAFTTKRQLPRSLLVLVTTCCSLLIGGCAGSMPTIAGAQPCTQGVCKAEVTVQWCWAGMLSVSPDPIRVPAPNNIEWTMKTEGFSFTNNGIVINGSGFTPRPGVTGNGKKFIVHDDHSDIRPNIKYAIRVVRDSDGAVCRPLDPMISNE